MMNQKLVLTVPSTNGEQKPDLLGHQRMTDLAERQFAEWFGGFTTIPGRGGWVSEICGKVVEDVALVSAFCTEEKMQAHLENVFALAAEVAFLMGQECVAVEVNGCLHFVDAAEPAVTGRKAA